MTVPGMRSSSFSFRDRRELRHTTRMIPASNASVRAFAVTEARKCHADCLALNHEFDGRASLDYG